MARPAVCLQTVIRRISAVAGPPRPPSFPVSTQTNRRSLHNHPDGCGRAQNSHPRPDWQFALQHSSACALGCTQQQSPSRSYNLCCCSKDCKSAEYSASSKVGNSLNWQVLLNMIRMTPVPTTTHQQSIPSSYHSVNVSQQHRPIDRGYPFYDSNYAPLPMKKPQQVTTFGPEDVVFWIFYWSSVFYSGKSKSLIFCVDIPHEPYSCQ